MIIIDNFVLPKYCFECPLCNFRLDEDSVRYAGNSGEYVCGYLETEITAKNGGYIKRKQDCPLIEIPDNLKQYTLNHVQEILNEDRKKQRREKDKEQQLIDANDEHLQHFATCDGFTTIKEEEQ